MKKANPSSSFLKFEKSVLKNSKLKFSLRLYIAGTTSQSQRAVLNIKRICEQHLHGRYALEIVDVYLSPLKAKQDHIIAVPTLVKLKPLPVKLIVGDLANEQKVLIGLGVVSRGLNEK